MKRMIVLFLGFHLSAMAAPPDPWEKKLIGQFVRTVSADEKNGIGARFQIFDNLEISSELGQGDIRRITGRRYEISIHGAYAQKCEILIGTPEEAKQLTVAGVRGPAACTEAFSGVWSRFIAEEQPGAEPKTVAPTDRLKMFVGRINQAVRAAPSHGGGEDEVGGLR